jgi:hypothetical protein
MASMEKMIGDYKILVRKPEEKISLEIPMARWDDNIKMDLGELGMTMWTDSYDYRY